MHDQEEGELADATKPGAKSLIGSYALFLRMFGIAERTVYEASSSV